MKYTKNQLIEKIEKKETHFFQDIYHQIEGFVIYDSEIENKIEKVWELNFGDGNDLFVAIKFPEEDLCVYMKGQYSSYDYPRIYEASIGVPYEHTETRYRKANLDEIRDMKINELIK